MLMYMLVTQQAFAQSTFGARDARGYHSSMSLPQVRPMEQSAPGPSVRQRQMMSTMPQGLHGQGTLYAGGRGLFEGVIYSVDLSDWSKYLMVTPYPDQQVRDLSVSANGRSLYILQDYSLSAINRRDHTIAWRIRLGSFPEDHFQYHRLALGSDGQSLYVLLVRGGRPDDEGYGKIDIRRVDLTGPLPRVQQLHPSYSYSIPNLYSAVQIAAAPDGGILLTGNIAQAGQANRFSLLHIPRTAFLFASRVRPQEFVLDGAPVAITVDRQRNIAYVATDFAVPAPGKPPGHYPLWVDAIDLSRNRVLFRQRVGDAAEMNWHQPAIALNRDGTMLAVYTPSAQFLLYRVLDGGRKLKRLFESAARWGFPPDTATTPCDGRAAFSGDSTWVTFFTTCHGDSNVLIFHVPSKQAFTLTERFPESGPMFEASALTLTTAPASRRALPAFYDGGGVTLGDAPADSGGRTRETFFFNLGDRIALMCDWHGSGTVAPGLFDPASGRWSIADRLPPTTWQTFQFGAAGDQPVCGDWDGDGRQTVGIKRGSTWFLARENKEWDGQAITFQFGQPNDLAVAGDWDGDGIDTVGAVHGNEWSLRFTNRPWSNARVVTLTNTCVAGPDCHPVVGDWDDDGADGIGVVQTSGPASRSHLWQLRNEFVPVGDPQVSFEFGSNAARPLVWRGELD